MSVLLRTWTPEKIAVEKDPAKAYAQYLSQTLGVPAPTIKDLTILRKKTKDLFEMYPQADWFTMCRLAMWAKARKRRMPRVWMLVDKYRDAWAAGFLPELDATEREDIDVEAGIAKALETETRPGWRRRLTMTTGVELRRGVLLEWQADTPTSSRSDVA